MGYKFASHWPLDLKARALDDTLTGVCVHRKWMRPKDGDVVHSIGKRLGRSRIINRRDLEVAVRQKNPREWDILEIH